LIIELRVCMTEEEEEDEEGDGVERELDKR
jgi:hypothetical protein